MTNTTVICQVMYICYTAVKHDLNRINIWTPLLKSRLKHSVRFHEDYCARIVTTIGY